LRKGNAENEEKAQMNGEREREREDRKWQRSERGGDRSDGETTTKKVDRKRIIELLYFHKAYTHVYL
jgi:hypothetical protein